MSSVPANAQVHSEPAAITPFLTFFLAAAVAIVVLNLYASQPLLGLIGPAFGLTGAQASLVTTLTLLGYAAGLVFLVPLVDIFANRRLIVLTLTGCIAALGVACLATSASIFFMSAVAIGFASTAIQMLVPVAAALAPPEQRGRVVGNVMSGLMIGTLLSRPIASLVAEAFGWRMFYALTAFLIAILTVAIMKVIPERRPPAGPRYGALIASLGSLLRDEPVLLRRSIYQFLLMGAFSVFWTTVALRLGTAPFELGQRGIALFSLAAAGAVIVAPIAGRLADQGRTRSMTFVAQTIVVSSMVLAAIADGAEHLVDPQTSPAWSLGLLTVSAFLLSLGVTADQILGRHAINMLQGEARGRINGIYTGLMFLGGSLGAFLGGYAWGTSGWPAVYCLALAFGVAALVLSSLQRG